jgi:hypothetical protein
MPTATSTSFPNPPGPRVRSERHAVGFLRPLIGDHLSPGQAVCSEVFGPRSVVGWLELCIVSPAALQRPSATARSDARVTLSLFIHTHDLPRGGSR